MPTQTMSPAHLPTRLSGKLEVDARTGCWLWAGAIGGSGEGYGLLTYQGKPGRAHVQAYELLVGPVPDGLELDHLCRITRCCNPVHLEPVTHAENLRRHFDTPTCRRGHPWDQVNTRRSPSTGRRYCNACNTDRARRRYQRLHP